MEDPERLWQLKSTEAVELAGGGPGGGGALWCSLARVTSGVGVVVGGDSALCGGGGGIRRLSETNFESGGPLPLTQQLNCCLFFTLSFSHFSFQQCRQLLLLLLLSRIRFCVCASVRFCVLLCVCVCTCLPRICTAHTQSAHKVPLSLHCTVSTHTVCTQMQRVSHDKGYYTTDTLYSNQQQGNKQGNKTRQD